MLFVNYTIGAPRDELLSNLLNGDKLIADEEHGDKVGRPKMHVKIKDDRVKIKCEMIGLPTKDNGFIQGTAFIGKISEKAGRCALSGVILTEPIYHFIFLIMLGIIIYQAITMAAIPITAIFLVLFNLLMFKDEFKKQSIIKRYIFEAFKSTYRETAKRQ